MRDAQLLVRAFLQRESYIVRRGTRYAESGGFCIASWNECFAVRVPKTSIVLLSNRPYTQGGHHQLRRDALRVAFRAHRVLVREIRPRLYGGYATWNGLWQAWDEEGMRLVEAESTSNYAPQ